MRNSWFVFALCMAAAPLAAQGHDNMREPKASGLMIVRTDLRVGDRMLPADEYRVVCDRQQIKFMRKGDGKRVLTTECKGREMHERAKDTVAVTEVDRHGVTYLKRLLLPGSNIEHVFQ